MAFFCVFLSDLLHIISLLCFFSLFFKLKKRYKNIVVSLVEFIMLILISYIISIKGYELFDVILYFAYTFIFLFTFFKVRLSKIIVPAFWVMFIVSMINLISKVLVGIFVSIKDINYNVIKSNEYDVLASVVSLIFISMVGLMYDKRYSESIIELGRKNIIGFSLLTLVDTVTVMIIASTVMVEMNDKTKIAFCVAFIGVILGIFIQLAAVILLLMQKKLYKEREEFARKYLDEQKSHYDFLENRERETKKFRHDIKSHMGMLKELVECREYNKFDEYVEALHMKVDKFGKAVTVHNGVVDAVVNQYYEKAKSLGVIMNVSGRFPVDCEINAYDICTIFSNALSNAIEAAEKSDEKKVELSCRYTDKNIIIVVKNSYKNVGQFKDGKMETTKNDKLYHGFGFANIKETVVNNKGMLDVDITDNEFKLSIMIGYMEKRNYENSNCG